VLRYVVCGCSTRDDTQVFAANLQLWDEEAYIHTGWMCRPQTGQRHSTNRERGAEYGECRAARTCRYFGLPGSHSARRWRPTTHSHHAVSPNSTNEHTADSEYHQMIASNRILDPGLFALVVHIIHPILAHIVREGLRHPIRA